MTTRNRNTTILIVIGVLATLLVIATVAVLLSKEAEAQPVKSPTAVTDLVGEAVEDATEPTTFDASGTLTLIDSGIDYYGGDCFGSSGYDDISEGAQVVIYDNTGAMIASGSLGPGERGDSSALNVVCDFDFTVPDVPIADADLYSVEVAHRGQVPFHQNEASSLDLSLG